MIRAFVLYSDKPDPERYAEHVVGSPGTELEFAL